MLSSYRELAGVFSYLTSWGWPVLLGSGDGNIKPYESNDAERPNEAEESQIEKLFPELLDRIFQLLSPQDLMSVVQVCRLWREEGERPRLWTWRVVRLTRENLSTMPEVLATRRMMLVRTLKVQNWDCLSGELLEAVMRHPGLRRLDLRGANLSSLEPGLLARAVAGMEEVQMGYCPVSSQQAEAIFTAVAAQTKLRKLHLSYTDLSSMEPGLLARVVVSLPDVNIRSTELTNQQVEAILAAIGKDTRLKKLDLGENISLESMDPDLLAAAINMLEYVNIDYVWIRRLKLESLFTSFRQQTKLKTMKIGFNENKNFFGVDTQKNVVNVQAKVKLTLAEVKRDTVLEAKSLRALNGAFCFGLYLISFEQDRFTIMNTNY